MISSHCTPCPKQCETASALDTSAACFQNHNLIGTLTALENLIMTMAFTRNVPASAQRKSANNLLDRLGLSAYANVLPKRMSAGQGQRVAVTRALANDPRMLLADEPTAALDEQSAVRVMDLLQGICTSSGAILIVASHDPALVSRFNSVVDLRAFGWRCRWRKATTSRVRP